MREIKIGRTYQHFKGKLYKVIGVGKHSETLEELVFYREVKGNAFWARPEEMFLEKVLFDGRKIPRFKLVENDKR